MGRRRSIAVAGGGIGGLAAAAALAARGFEVIVVERAARIATAGSGLVLYPNGVRAVDALGGCVGARIRSAGHVTGRDEVRVLMDSRGTVLAEEPIGVAGETLGAPQIPVLRSALQRVLLDEAVRAGVAVVVATAVESYAGHEDFVTVRLSDDNVLDVDALVGADGIHSAVRRQMLGDDPPHYRGYTSVRGRTSGSVLGQRGHVVSGRGVQLFIAPVGGDTLYWTAKITSPPGVWPAKGPGQAQRELTAALEGWYGPVVDLVRHADPGDIVVTDIHDRDPAPRWTDGRVALLGDAAHPMVPSLGQGANIALEDAVVLAECMASHADVPAALEAYAGERMDRAAAVVLHSRSQGALDQGDGRGGEEKRNARIRAAGRKDAELADVLGWQPRGRTAAAEVPRTEPAVAAPPVRSPGRGTPHVVLVSGSLRAGSTCDRVASWCAERVTERGASARVFNGAEIDFPAYRPGLEETHEGVAAFLDELRRADGVVLVSPSYHATVSGLLKNALDFVNDIQGPLPYLEGRAIGTVAVGAAAEGAVSTLTTLRTIGHALRGWPTPVGVAVSQAPARPGRGTADDSADRLVQMVSQVLWMSGAQAVGRPARLGAAAA